MKLIKKVDKDNTINYFKNKILKYRKYSYSSFEDIYYCWEEFDKKGNVIHSKVLSPKYKNSNDFYREYHFEPEWWAKYDKDNNRIYYKDSSGYEKHTTPNEIININNINELMNVE